VLFPNDFGEDLLNIRMLCVIILVCANRMDMHNLAYGLQEL